MKKVALGMSGGVDSSLCAHLLIEQGYDVTGVYLECWKAPGCRSEEDRKDALKVALELNIPFQVLDFKDAYKERVVEYFFSEYEAGKTPNPDVMCNKEIKFGLFYEWAMEHNFDFVATGHYAAIEEIQEDSLRNKYLKIPTDKHKDQTYFLYLVTNEQLNHTLFPLGEMTKDTVRQQAEQRGIHVSNKKDSVGICFIGDINVHEFLKERLGENPGEVIDSQGNVIGRHKGLWFHTVGQRSGFEIFAKTLIHQSDGSTLNRQNIPPFYVIKKRPETNQLVVGFGAETLRTQFSITSPYWTNTTPSTEMEYLVRIRHTGQLIPCRFRTINRDNGDIELSEQTKGIAEGQAAVFYQSLPTGAVICIGGGTIA